MVCYVSEIRHPRCLVVSAVLALSLALASLSLAPPYPFSPNRATIYSTINKALIDGRGGEATSTNTHLLQP